MLVARDAERRRCRIEAIVQQEVGEGGLTGPEMSRLFSVLSHDMKSPIFAIDGFSELLLSDYESQLGEEGADFLRRIRSSVQHLKRVLDDMSRIVKLLSRDNVRRPTPLKELVEEVLLRHNYAIEEGNVAVDVAGNLPTVDVDPEKFREALGSLISNALFFSDRPKGERKISIEYEPGSNAHRICVRDNGIGIDPRYASQVFELGGASKLDKSRGGGPGYGLFLARHVVESHGGSLTFDSVLNEGSRFCMTLPR